jgi:hypothetical protein
MQPATDIHHRRRKGMGGSARLERPSNLITLCGLGNTTGHHGHVHQNPELAHARGWLLYEHQNPAETPVLTAFGWRLFDDDGHSGPCPAPGGEYARDRCRRLRPIESLELP